MKRFYCICLLLLPLLLQGQNKQVVVRGFKQADITDRRARTFPVMDKNERLTALVDIAMPVMDSTVRFDGIVGIPELDVGAWLVHVAEGTKRIKIYLPGCAPIDYSFPLNIESGRVYQMKLGIVEDLTLILPLFSYTTDQMSGGVLLGHLWKGHGGYIKAKTNFVFGLRTSLECTTDGVIDGAKGWFTGESKKSRYSITGGYLGRIYQNHNDFGLYVYVGGGFGERILAWEAFVSDDKYEYAMVTPHSYKGMEAETGIVFRWKDIAIMAGVQTNQFKTIEFNVGFGMMF